MSQFQYSVQILNPIGQYKVGSDFLHGLSQKYYLSQVMPLDGEFACFMSILNLNVA